MDHASKKHSYHMHGEMVVHASNGFFLIIIFLFYMLM